MSVTYQRMTQEELDRLVATAAPEPRERTKQRHAAQLRLQRLWDENIIEYDNDWKPRLK